MVTEQRNKKTSAAPSDAVIDINVVHARLYQATACVSAIDVILGDRARFPEADTIADEVLNGLASAAVELLYQADEAAKGWRHAGKVRRESSHATFPQ